MKPPRILPFLLGLRCFAASAAGQPVRAWQDSIQLPSVREGDAVATPQFEAWTPDAAHYPYALRTNLGKVREVRTWRTLNLENEYLFCRVLPDLGGHLYSCRDKRNGREIFYANPVIKPGLVGLRGSWVALGIESNFPIGHTRATTSPVDFALRTEADGSARAVLEDIDRITGMQWHVEFVLRPGSTVIEQRVTLYNRSPVRWSYYWWANAGIAFDDPGTRIILPTRVVSTHASPSEIVPWPVHPDGKDGTLIANHKNAAAWFPYESREPFFAVYKPASRSGLAYFADPTAAAGKKLWLWGSDQDRWVRRELTDNFPSYIEMQGGVFQDQDTFGFLEPGQVNSFSEYWIPIYEMGGVSRVSRDVILNLVRQTNGSKGPSLQIELSSTHAIENAGIRVLNADKVVYETHADLTATSTYRHVLDNPSGSSYAIEVTDARSSVLLRHTEDRYDGIAPADAPMGKISEPDWSRQPDSEALYIERGSYNELHQHRAAAVSDYAAGLGKFPASLALKKAAGRLYLGLDRFTEAAELLASVVAAAPSDDEAAYYLGTALAMAGRDPEARQTLSKINPDSAFRRPAALQLARIEARAKNDVSALAHLKPLLSDRSGPSRAGALEVALLRRLGRAEDAKRALAGWIAVDPADSMLRFENTLLGGADAELWNHLAADSERVLDLADEYLGLGMAADVLPLLEHAYPQVAQADVEPGAVPVVLSPMIAYYRAFCRTQLHQDASSDLRAAAAGFTRYLFPYRASSYAVLASAVKLNPSDALAHFLMGRLYLQGFRTDEAIVEWQQARTLYPALPELDYDLGRTLIEIKKDAAAGFTVVKEGLKANPEDADLLGLLRHAADASAAVAPAGNGPATAPTSPVDVARAALRKAAGGNAVGAAALFDARVFVAERQPDEVRRNYIEVQLQKLVSMARAGQCEAALNLLFRLGDEDAGLGFTLHGFDNFMKAPHFQYYAGALEADCHDAKAARKRWTKISKMAEPAPSPEFAFPILAAWSLNPEEAKPKIAAGLDLVRAALAKADAQSRPPLIYLEGMLLHAAGREQGALQCLQDVLKTSDAVWLEYLARIEMQQIYATGSK